MRKPRSISSRDIYRIGLYAGLMVEISYECFQREVGSIIIRWAVAEEHFRQLLAATAGLPEREGEIVFNKVAAIHQRRMLMQLARLRHDADMQDRLAFCAKLHDTNSGNRNLFAHGHIGFGPKEGSEPAAMCIKLHAGTTLYNKFWEVPFSDVQRIGAQINEFDGYARYLTMRLRNPESRIAEYRPDDATDYATKWVNLDELIGMEANAD